MATIYDGILGQVIDIISNGSRSLKYSYQSNKSSEILFWDMTHCKQETKQQSCTLVSL